MELTFIILQSNSFCNVITEFRDWLPKTVFMQVEDIEVNGGRRRTFERGPPEGQLVRAFMPDIAWKRGVLSTLEVPAAEREAKLVNKISMDAARIEIDKIDRN